MKTFYFGYVDCSIVFSQLAKNEKQLKKILSLKGMRFPDWID